MTSFDNAFQVDKESSSTVTDPFTLLTPSAALLSPLDDGQEHKVKQCILDGSIYKVS